MKRLVSFAPCPNGFRLDLDDGEAIFLTPDEYRSVAAWAQSSVQPERSAFPLPSLRQPELHPVLSSLVSRFQKRAKPC